MEKVKIKVKNHEGLVLPRYMTDGSVGFDLIARGLREVYKGAKKVEVDLFARSLENGYFVLRPQERALVGTNLFIELPKGKQLEVRSRSGMALKRGLIVGNSPGTVDYDYRGEVCVILVNTTNFLARINFGDAIAQGVITDAYQAEWELVDELSITQRGSGGFGHTSLWKPEVTREINTLDKDTIMEEADIAPGSYLVTGPFALVFPLSYTFVGNKPYDGRKVNKITVYMDKTYTNQYI